MNKINITIAITGFVLGSLITLVVLGAFKLNNLEKEVVKNSNNINSVVDFINKAIGDKEK